MSKNDTALKAADAQIKKSLSILKKRGLYNPKFPRRSPTKYAIKLTKKFADVVSGKAFAISVADKDTFAEYAALYPSSKKQKKIIIRKDEVSQQIRFDKKTKTLVRYRKTSNSSAVFKTIVLKKKVNDVVDLPSLKSGQTYTVPMYQTNGEIFVMTFESKEALRVFVAEYQKQNFKSIMRYVGISQIIKSRRGRDFDSEDFDSDD